MEKEDGMSHVTVFFSIVIMIGILIGGFFLIKNIYNNEKLETLKTNLVTLQAKVKVTAEEVVVKKEGVTYIGRKVSDILEDETIKSVIEKGIISSEEENFEGYYLLESKEDYSKLKVKNLNDKKTIVNYITFEIIYLEGFEINNTIYYKLSDFSKINEKKEIVNETTSEIVNEFAGESN